MRYTLRKVANSKEPSPFYAYNLEDSCGNLVGNITNVEVKLGSECATVFPEVVIHQVKFLDGEPVEYSTKMRCHELMFTAEDLPV